MSLSSSIIRSAAELDGLADEWEALAAPAASPLFDHSWLAAAAHSVHGADDLRVHVVRDNGRLVAAAPLAVDRSRRRLALIGTETLYEPAGWLFASDEAGVELARVCARSGQSTVLQRLPDAARLARVISGALTGRAITVRRGLAPSYGVVTGGGWEDFLAGLSTRTVRSMERLKERAEREAGEWSHAMLRPGPDEVGPAIDRLVAIEGSGWKGREGSSLSQRRDLRAFFADYGMREARRGRLRIGELRFGGHCAAMEFAIEAHGRLWGLKIAYDETFAAVAPALQLAHASIRTACDGGLQSYEFLGVAAAWQERWRPVRREYGLLAIYPFSIAGVSTLARDAWSVMRKQSEASR